jgi:hypothetical protein
MGTTCTMASHADADQIFEATKAWVHRQVQEELVKNICAHDNHDRQRFYQIAFQDYTRVTGTLELMIDREKIQMHIRQSSGDKFTKIRPDLVDFIQKHNLKRWEGIRGNVGHQAK